jgi:nicotinamidase-related amidase
MQVVVVLDMLKEFWEQRAFRARTQKIVPKMKMLIDAAKKTGNSVIYVCDTHRPTDMLYWKIAKKHALIGTRGAEVMDALKPETEELVVHKRNVSGFFGSDLEITLRGMMADTLILVGSATNLSVLHTAVDAFQRYFKVVVVEDCTSGTTEEEHQWALRHLRGSPFKIEVLNSEEVVKRYFGISET